MEDILAGFEPTSAATWKEKLAKDLKGITFEQLRKVDDNGITIEPFYTIEDTGSKRYSPVFEHTDWSILERIVVEDEAEANRQALKALSTGASGLLFEIHQAATDWTILLTGIEVAFIYTCFDIRHLQAANLSALQAYLQVHGATMTTIGHDVLAAYAAGTAVAEDFEARVALIAGHTHQVVVDGSLYFNAGAHSAYQLALITAQVNEYLQALSDRDALNALTQIHLRVATGTAFFEEIAKLRALRQLLQLLTAQYGCEPAVHIQVCTGTLYKAPFDAYNNLLRDTLAGMAGVVGGCDTLYILPFDEGYPKGKEAFSRRMSINEQLLLKEESYLHHIADVANGSYYLETLTEQLGSKAWDMFKAIEAEGGFIRSVAAGTVKETVAVQAEALIAQYRSGERVWIGMNKYPNPVDMPQELSVAQPNFSGVRMLNLAAELFPSSDKGE